ncbi:integrator complex subunit 1 [Uranotaenia lowii]|uniref:integrator complex subunit 1 n=1 Tax=Uranotaenia lowii TaxID=190385 RepID=UPI00247AF05F|nr:integrator complex subunit 1 [Uranotaenia lowii]
MDRNKPGSSGRSTKKPINLPQSELFALGSKSGGSSRDDVKSKTGVGVGGVPERKRDTPGSLVSTAATKKIKIGGLGSSGSSVLGASLVGTSKSSSGGDSSSSSSVLEYWEQVALDCESVDLVSSVMSAIDQQDSDSVVGYICGAIKLLISPKSKSESVLSLSLLYLAKVRPHLFCNETITSALIAVLKRDSQNSFKGRNNPTIHILACNLLARGYSDKKQWPESLIRAYIEDAINDRVWVDYEECAPFTDNCVAAFGTKIPPKWMLQPELSTLNPAARDNPTIDDELSTDSGMFGDALGKDPDANPPRFAHIQEQVEKLVVDAAKDQLNRRQAPDCSTRNFLKFLSLASGVAEMRALAIPRLELWIHNGKLMKPAQELLTFICYNVTGQNPKDHEVLSNLVRMRLKTKPLINIFMICLKEMLNSQAEILTIMLKYVIQNELSNARNPNNMGMLATMFQAKPKESATHLAEIYQECLLQREDVLRTLRVFLRELVKMLRYDIDLMEFCKALLTNRQDLSAQIAAFEFRDRIFHSIVDLVCLCMFLSVSPQIREANASIRSGREQKSSPVLSAFYHQMSTIQFVALTWMHGVVPVLYKPSPADFKLAFHKLLILDSPEAYAKGDQWPPEPERAPLLRMVSEIPLQQNSMLRIILIGITKDIPFTIPDTMEIIEQLVRRAGSLRHIDYPPLEVANLEIIDLLFKMSEYHHPDNIVLPQNYEPPNLAISSLYWKTWIILLLISSHNPSVFGSFCWQQYPMLRTLMEMCITNQIGPTKPSDDELQVATAEKSQILEFENHLASTPITEQNSLLLSQLILMDPRGVARRPPNQVLEQIQSLNVTHRLGHLLCRSRKPDLLLEIIQRQGTSQAMPWLADLVQNSDGDFNHLPVQCLCEFLLSNSSTVIVENSREAELLDYLQKVIQDETGDHQVICEILEYFLRRLSSFSNQARMSSIRGLKLLLKVFQEDNDPVPIESNNSDWLLRYLPMIPHFLYVRSNVVVQLRAACQVENSPELVMVYIQFIAAHTSMDSESDMLEHVMDMSHLIVERSTIFSHIIPTPTDQSEGRVQTLNCLFVMFNNFLIKLREFKVTQSFTEYQDLLLVQFADESQCHIHLNIIQAFVILLTHSVYIPVASQILDYWFPEGAPPPQAFNIETSEPVQILPDWLKLKMIRSNVDRLVDAALLGLTPDQIVLFVQNFGTPINSMSKLLALLDRAVIEQFESVNNAILHKKYLAQLIEIQQARGAKNGHISIQALELDNQPVGDPPMMNVTVMEPLQIDLSDDDRPRTTSDPNKPVSKTKEIEEAVEIILTHPVISKANKAKYRKLIERLISSNKTAKSQEYTANKVVNYLGRLVKSSQGQYMVKNWTQNPQMCCFFRSLFEVSPDKFENLNYFLHILDEIIKYMNPASNTVLLQILVGKRQQLIKFAQKDHLQSQTQPQNLYHALTTNKLAEVESKGKQQLRNTSNSKTINVISTLLTSNVDVKSEHSDMQYDNRGMLVDWLASADSELVHVNKDLQMGLLFRRGVSDYRPYLLSLMSNETSWATLHQTVEMLMDRYNENYEPSSVLDFVETITKNPKLWQGRDKGVPKHEQTEYIVVLSEPQVKTFIDYILAEADQEKISQRVKLLLQCTDGHLDYLKAMVEYADGSNHASAKNFLQQLYLNCPPMKFLMPHIKSVYDADVRAATGCVGDKFAYFILTTIACLNNARDVENHRQTSAEMELIVRKLAASHPILLLRQLSVLSTLLQGRAHMDLSVLRAEYHFHLFHQVMGIMELLQPLIFNDSYQSGLQNALDCYFALLKNHGSVKETYTLIYRFMEFLQAYIGANPNTAVCFIQKHSDLLNDLAQQHFDLQSLQQLVQGLSMFKQQSLPAIESHLNEPMPGPSKERDLKPVVAQQSTVAVMMPPYVKNEIIPSHWPELVHALRSREIEDISLPLNEVDNLTVKRPALLEEIFDEIIRFVIHPSATVRATAHALVARWLKQNPGNFSTNSTALTAFVQCLYHEDVAIVQSALDKTTEYTLCLQEYAPQIMVTVFNLGISSKIDTYTALRRCVQAIKKQHAC